MVRLLFQLLFSLTNPQRDRLPLMQVFYLQIAKRAAQKFCSCRLSTDKRIYNLQSKIYKMPGCVSHVESYIIGYE